MSLRHQHQWTEIARTYAPPTALDSFKAWGEQFERIASRALFGLTTIIWECKGCQAIRREEMLGKEQKP